MFPVPLPRHTDLHVFTAPLVILRVPSEVARIVETCCLAPLQPPKILLVEEEASSRRKLDEAKCGLPHWPSAGKYPDAFAAAELVGVAFYRLEIACRPARHKTYVAMAAARVDEEDMARLHL